jgi:PmbA protein
LTEILSAAETAVKLAMQRGFDEVEAFSTKIIKREVIYREKIEAAKTSTIAGLSIRGVLGKRIGFYSVSSLDRRDIENAIDQSLKIAKANREDADWHALPRKCEKATVQKVIDRKIESLSANDLVEQVRLAVDTVHEVEPSLVITRGYTGTGIQFNAIANSHGCKLERKETAAASWIAVKAGTAEEKGVSHEGSQSRFWKGLNTERIATTASERALKMLHARPIPNGKMNTVWRNDAFASIVDTMLARTVTADAVQRNRSPWTGKLGEIVASREVSIIDEGKMVAGMATRQFDDDGTPQKRVPVIEKGVLRSFLYDTYTANKEGRASTGNAHRDIGTFFTPPNYAKLPTPYPNNLAVEPKKNSPDEIIRETRNGLYVVEIIGEWLSNPISGEVSATLSGGFVIENGELGRAVKGIIVSSNFFDILKGKMDLRANDLDVSGSVYAPTTQVLDMTVAGE